MEFKESEFKLRAQKEIKEGEEERKEFLPIADEIKNWIEKTSDSDETKTQVLEKSLKIYKQIEHLPFPEEEKLKASLFLSYEDDRSTPAGQIPRPKLKVLSEARRITKIERVEAIQMIDSMCKLTKRSEKVAEKAKEILKEFKEKYPNDYRKGSPSATTLGVLYISSILCGEHITQNELSKSFGIMEGTIRNRYKDIEKKLDIDILKSFFSIKH